MNREVSSGPTASDCPCCISQTGSTLPPFSTASRDPRPDVAPSSFTGSVSDWASTVTIPGQPIANNRIMQCAACEGSVCVEWYGSEATVSETSLSRRDEPDLLQPFLTNPDGWKAGSFDWWRKAYDNVRLFGASFGPGIKNREKLDPVVRKWSHGSHAKFIPFDFTTSTGERIYREKGFIGGVTPIWGCTAILIATDRGVYTAHLWEVPTFKPPGTLTRPRREAELEWDWRVTQFFKTGNEGIIDPKSPALAELAAEGREFSDVTRRWITVHIWTPYNTYNIGTPRFPNLVEKIDEELIHHLKIEKSQIQRHLYMRKPPKDAFGNDINPHEFYSAQPGTSLVMYQYAPKEKNGGQGEVIQSGEDDSEDEESDHEWDLDYWSSDEDANIGKGKQPARKPEPKPKPDEKPGDKTGEEPSKPGPELRALRIWFDRKQVETKLWCPHGANCEEFCEREIGLLQQTSPTSTQALSSFWRRAKGIISPRTPRTHGGLFGDKLTHPDAWPSRRAWWERVYHFVTSYGAVADPMGVESGDDYSPNNAVYTPLGDYGIGGGTGPLFGCTALLIATEKGVYVAHIWQRPTFVGASHDRHVRSPHLYEPEALWKRRITDLFELGTQPKAGSSTRPGPSLVELSQGELGPAGPGGFRVVFLIVPDRTRDIRANLSGKPRYKEGTKRLKREVADILGISRKDIHVRTYFKREPGSTFGFLHQENPAYYRQNAGNNLLFWQYGPAHSPPQQLTGQDTVKAIRIWWDKRVIANIEWCPENAECHPVPSCGATDDESSGEAGPSLPLLPRNPAAGLLAGYDGANDTVSPHNVPGFDLVRRGEATPSQTSQAPPESATSEEPASLAPPDDYNDLWQDGIFQPQLTHPDHWELGPNDWWRQMKNNVDMHGASTGKGYPSPDDFYSDHATFRKFTENPIGTGVTPMWGCTGMVVVSNVGVYVAHFWQIPLFEHNDPRSTNRWSYEPEDIWQRRVPRLLYHGYPPKPEWKRQLPAVPALADLTKPGQAFDPDFRDWIKVTIITPDAETGRRTKNELYADKIERLRQEVAEVLDIDPDGPDMMTRTYRIDQYRQFGQDSDDMDALFDNLPGVHLIGLQYAPDSSSYSKPEEKARSLRLWWSRKILWRIDWCPPDEESDSDSDESIISGKGKDKVCGSRSGSPNAPPKPGEDKGTSMDGSPTGSANSGSPTNGTGGQLPSSNATLTGSGAVGTGISAPTNGSTVLPSWTNSTITSTSLGVSGTAGTEVSITGLPTNGTSVETPSFNATTTLMPTGTSNTTGAEVSITGFPTNGTLVETLSTNTTTTLMSTGVSNTTTVLSTDTGPLITGSQTGGSMGQPTMTGTLNSTTVLSGSESEAGTGTSMIVSSTTTTKAPRPTPSGNTCGIQIARKVFPYQDMYTEMTGIMGKFEVFPNNTLGIFYVTYAEIFNITLGDMVQLYKRDTEQPFDMRIYSGQSWEDHLWNKGYRCECDGPNGACDIYSRKCCSAGNCDDVDPYICNCENPDTNDILCWPDHEDVASCCVTEEGCGWVVRDPDLSRPPLDQNLPRFKYAGWHWHMHAPRPRHGLPYPPEQPWCEPLPDQMNDFGGGEVGDPAFGHVSGVFFPSNSYL